MNEEWCWCRTLAMKSDPRRSEGVVAAVSVLVHLLGEERDLAGHGRNLDRVIVVAIVQDDIGGLRGARREEIQIGVALRVLVFLVGRPDGFEGAPALEGLRLERRQGCELHALQDL